MKIFIFSHESAGKTGMNAVDRFLISCLVPEKSTFKEPKHDTQNGSLQTTTTVKIVTS